VTAPFLFVGCVAAFYPHCRGSRRSGRNGVTFHRIEPASPPGVASMPMAVSKNLRTETGTSSYSMYRRRSSSAMSKVTSRDQPSAVLKATIRTGFSYCPSSKLRPSFSLQTLNLMNDGEWLRAGANIGLSVVLCLVAVWAGHSIALSLAALKIGWPP